jgi:hypothetical protein
MQVNGRPIEIYRTKCGRAFLTRAEAYLPSLPENSVDLVVTSPPFALLCQKAYGNLDQSEYVDWLVSFGPLVRRVFKETGSFVLDLRFLSCRCSRRFFEAACGEKTAA